MKSLAFFTATSAGSCFRRCVPALLGAATLLCLAPAPSAHAQAYVPAFTLNPEPPAQGNLIKPILDYVLGYHFNTDEESKVIAFGIYVPTTTSHTIGIWDAKDYSNSNPKLGSLIWQKQISPSSSCNTIGSYCWFSISDSPTLKAMNNYVVAATWGAGDEVPFKLDNVSSKPSPGFRFGDAANSESPIFSGLVVDFSDPAIAADYTPNGSDNTKIGFLSVNLSFETPTPTSAQVPAPIPMLGVAAAFGWSRKIRRRINSSS